ncbi:antithrombin-III-like [Homalodisca vitripennis]|uniref:antithrombin-III-like n=1 Tax=Homalodisca vitripennis TaxID=197043 RepID=UPI001EE9FCC4|nr:antithrombin-III-like [Homalodisca vitripennis]
MIVDCIPEGFLDKSTSLLLVNAVYFKGLWKSRFNKDKTSPEDFYMADGSTRQAEMMKQRSSFRAVFSSSYGIHGLELPYDGDDISMFIILPEQSHATAVLKDFGADELLEFVDLSDLVEKFNEFKLDKAIHTAKIVVDEQGTEAVAVTKLMSVSGVLKEEGNISSISSK